jgi:predicted RNase H-like HicB family nuclease
MSETEFTINLIGCDDGWTVAECVELPGCVAKGRTLLSALDNINDAIREAVELRARMQAKTDRDAKDNAHSSTAPE